MNKHFLYIFNKIITEGGIKVFKKPLFPRKYNIFKIKAVVCTERISHDSLNDTDLWNFYVDKVNNICKVNTYSEWIYNENGLYGILIFYDKNDKEIKTKHINSYKLKKLI